MTVVVNDGGWWILTDGTDSMTIRVKKWTYNLRRKPNNNKYPAKSNLGYDLNYQWLEITIEDAILTSYTNYANFVKYINDWQDTNGHFTVSMQYISTPAYAELKGTGYGTTFTMQMKKGLESIEKVALGDEQIWIVHKVELDEAG